MGRSHFQRNNRPVMSSVPRDPPRPSRKTPSPSLPFDPDELVKRLLSVQLEQRAYLQEGLDITMEKFANIHKTATFPEASWPLGPVSASSSLRRPKRKKPRYVVLDEDGSTRFARPSDLAPGANVTHYDWDASDNLPGWDDVPVIGPVKPGRYMPSTFGASGPGKATSGHRSVQGPSSQLFGPLGDYAPGEHQDLDDTEDMTLQQASSGSVLGQEWSHHSTQDLRGHELPIHPEGYRADWTQSDETRGTSEPRSPLSPLLRKVDSVWALKGRFGGKHGKAEKSGGQDATNSEPGSPRSPKSGLLTRFKR